MAYCYATCENGLNFKQYTDLRDLLMNRRDDVFNFVGQILFPENLESEYLHAFYFRNRGSIQTVIVHLFASFGGPAYEVVLEC